MAVVELVWGSIGVPALGENQDVGGTTQWVREDGNGSEVDIRVVTWGLASRATVEVPLWEVIESEFTAFWDLEESLERTTIISICINFVGVPVCRNCSGQS